jgi:hypothetical protein
MHKFYRRYTLSLASALLLVLITILAAFDQANVVLAQPTPTAPVANPYTEPLVELSESLSKDLGQVEPTASGKGSTQKGVTPIATSTNQTFSVTLVVKYRNQAKFEALARDVNNPKSSRYHHFMSQVEYEREFAPDLPTAEPLP